AHIDYNYSPPGVGDGVRLRMAAERFDLDDHPFVGRSWKNVGLWQHELNKARYSDSLGPAPVDDSLAMVALGRIYTEVISSVRYVAVSIGLSGWQPEDPAVVASKRYGDCKGMSGLLVSRLRAAGIRANPCLVLTSDDGAVDSSFVAFDFNHVIAMAVIGRDTIWMDPTCDDCPAGDLPERDEHNTLLVVTDTGGVLVTTPSSHPDDNLFVEVCDAVIDDSGHITLATKASVTGNSAQHLRRTLNHAQAEDTKRWVGDWFIGNNKKYSTTRVATANLGNLARPVELEASFASVGLMDRIQKTGYFVPFLLTSRSYIDDAKLKERKTAVNFGSAWKIVDSVYLHGALLAVCDSVRVPESADLSFGPLHLAARFTKDSTGVRACLTQSLDGGEVPVEKFDSLAQFLTFRKQLLDKPIKFYLKAK
ncbi:MAG TPA: transglutaminase domain-containing protein, partial [Candidatus Acidoferrum sp.]|nr:transglutaminase domain-containing protein [Candidatus Acidoferrum sp.]